MAIVLKIARAGDIRRTQIQSLTPEQLERSVAQAFPELVATGFELRYFDDEGDLCILTTLSFPDFVALHKDKEVVKLEIRPQHRNVVPSGPGMPTPGEVTSKEPDAMQDEEISERHGSAEHRPRSHHPWPQLQEFFQSQQSLDLKRFLSSFAHGVHSAGPSGITTGPACSTPRLIDMAQCFLASASATPDALGSLLVHFGPILTSAGSGLAAQIDMFAAQQPALVLDLVKAVRRGIDPFPQLQESHINLDGLLQSGNLAGLGGAIHGLLRTIVQLPFEQQRDIITVAFQDVVGSLAHLQRGESDPSPPCHHSHVCDACEQAPIVGPRFKCKVCRDYDLCGSCFMLKNELHADHDFECITQPQQAPSSSESKDSRKRCHELSSPSVSNHGSASSLGTHGVSQSETGLTVRSIRHNGRKHHRRHSSSSSGGTSMESTSTDTSGMSALKRNFKDACKAAKKEYKDKIGALKKAYKNEAKLAKKALKQAKKDAQKVAKYARKLEKREKKLRSYVASTGFAMEPQQAEATPAIVGESTTRPEESFPLNDQVRKLLAMGFPDAMANARLLEAHNGDLQAAIDVLLRE